MTAVIFAMLHGSSDPWILSALIIFAVTASLVTWRTGGLEAAIAIHAVNNVGVFFLVLTQGGWADAFISQGSSGTPIMVGMTLLVHAAAVALVLWQAKRARIDRFYRPVPAVAARAADAGPTALAPAPYA